MPPITAFKQTDTSTSRKLGNKLGLDTLLCLALNTDSLHTKPSARELQAKSSKLKGLGGAPHHPRGACPIIDTPRSTSPPLAVQPIYRRRQPTL